MTDTLLYPEHPTLARVFGRQKSFNLAPRYSAGSPGLVWDERVAYDVARYERVFLRYALDGLYGEQMRQQAEQRGLDRIVYQLVHRGRFMYALGVA